MLASDANASPSDVQLATSPAAPSTTTRGRQLIAIGGGRGGVGKTLLTVNLAVYLAQLGRQVVVVDADPFGSNLHAMLGLNQPPLATQQELRSGAAAPIATTVPGLKLLPVAYDQMAVAPKRLSRMIHWLKPLAHVDADYVVFHLGASMAPAALDLFSEADAGICLTSPEPTAIEATYRFCRALFARRLRRTMMRESFKLRAVERTLAKLPPLPTPLQLISELMVFDESLAKIAIAALAQVQPCLVVGKTRLRRDLDLGAAMVSLAQRYLGVSLDYLGYIEQDDAVWLTARRRRPLLIDAPTSRAARNIERVARRSISVLAQRAKTSHAGCGPAQATTLGASMTLYKVLGIDRSASDDEIRRAYKLQRGIFCEDSLPIVSLVDDKLMGQEQALIHEAYDTLLDPARRRSYDMSVFPDERADKPAVDSQQAADGAELAQLQAELAREITAETQFTGALLLRVREARGVSLEHIANITKISKTHLRAIEAEELEALPALVYVGGFLRQVAKALQLDSAQVAKTYLRRARANNPGRT